MPTDPVAVLLELIERYGVECHAIGWHRATYGDAVPGHLREARDGARAMIEARLRALADDGGAATRDRTRRSLAVPDLDRPAPAPETALPVAPRRVSMVKPHAPPPPGVTAHRLYGGDPPALIEEWRWDGDTWHHWRKEG